MPGPMLHAGGTKMNATPPFPPQSSEFSKGDKQVNNQFPWYWNILEQTTVDT